MHSRFRTIARRLLAGLALAAAAPAAAQDNGMPRPHQEWRTTESRHFVFHYPSSMREWTLSVAERMDAIHGAVRDVVGYAPPGKVHVVVDDPLNESNGSAWPVLRAPAIYLWPTPPEPISAIGNNRSWGEILGVHEFAHVAHMARPSRNRRWWLRSPFGFLGFGPITQKAPRWVFEGYATVVEGRLTGHGRPRGVWRPAILREFAREGRMPGYAALNSTEGFYQGSLAYLAGSAYLEWLAAKHGDSTLVHLWRRLTAKQERTFDQAFAGVYGAPPAQLYGRFVAELTEQAMDAEEALGIADSAAAGETVVRHEYYAGDVAISPDGKLIATYVADRKLPTRVVVFGTVADTVTDKERKAREKLLERDPQDVPAVQRGPRPRKHVATLWPRRGSSFARPRWMPDGERLLVVHRDAQGDGSSRMDLWLWNHKRGTTRRITHGAGIRSADPAPDGKSAAAIRCDVGRCDVVVVDLAGGRVRSVAAGSPTVTYYRPRWSPDGRSIVAGVQREGRWRLVVIDAASGALRDVGPGDDFNVYDASFTRDGRALLAVSEQSGVPNVVRIDLASGAVQPVTRVFGAATGPEPTPAGDTVYFTSLYSRGMDIKRVVPSVTPVASVPRLDVALAPAAAVGVIRADTFAAGTLGREEGYGIGPRRHLLLPFYSTAVEGRVFGLTLAGTDVVGRLSYTLSAGGAITPDEADDRWLSPFAAEGMWRGGSLRAAWRGMRPALEADVFVVMHRPGEQRVLGLSSVDGFPMLRFLDVDYPGAKLGLALERDFGWRRHLYRAGVSTGRIDPEVEFVWADGGEVDEARHLGYAEFASRYRFTRRQNFVASQVGFALSGGRTFGESWNRFVATLGLSAGGPAGGITLDGTYGEAATNAAYFEDFVVGGARQPFLDGALLSQRIAMPALPVGILMGGKVAVFRAAIDGGAFAPYYWMAATDRDTRSIEQYYKVVGLEANLAAPSIPLVRTPGAVITSGLGYSLSDPLEKRWRGYLSVTYRP